MRSFIDRVSPRSSDRCLWHALLWIVFLAALFRISTHPLTTNHDAASVLHVGKMLLEGKLPYVDFISTNPPLIMYVNAIPAALSALFSVHIIPVFSILVLALALWSALTVRRIVSWCGLELDERELGFLVVVYAGVSFIHLYETFEFDFGQREHLFVLLYFPFFVSRWVRWEGGRLTCFTALSTGLFAALGACFKPHFVAIALLVELYWIVSKRSVGRLFSPEMLAFVGAGLLYPLHFFFLPALARDQYFGRWLPFVVERYSVYDNPLSVLIDRPSFLPFVVTSLLLVLVCPAGQGVARMMRPLGVATLGAVAAFFVQHKLWPYHLIPALFGAALIWAISVWRCPELLRRRRDGQVTFVVWLALQAVAVQTAAIAFFHRWLGGMPLWGYLLLVAVVVAFVHLRRALCAPLRSDDLPGAGMVRVGFVAVFGTSMLVLGWTPWESRDPLNGNPLAETVAEYTEEGDAVMFVATNTSAAFPLLVQMNRRPGSRFFVTWPIPLLYKDTAAGANGKFPYRRGPDVPPEELRFLDELADDVERNRPRLILVHQGSRNQACPEGFVLEDYLTEVGFVAKAMGDYLRAPDAGGYEVFVLSETKRPR